ncbi:RICIN domain-containing protein [Streptomyces bohaiensis]|uniref:RICIN domain-containing protein n=1 Tax=Streptomyces bohaiensis TaxID=1431344 RepID=A0ABX1CHC1_9ACTN|nr:RICIN domain-containing protein [Streptomyces bohaiensis]NJQ17323.1 RICIN domain-containing protein [Streptomyces bohaiensis]
MTQEPSPKFADTFARRPTVGRRGLLPGKRVYTTTAWSVAVAALVAATAYGASAVIPGDQEDDTLVAPVSSTKSPATPPKPAPSPAEEEEEEDENEAEEDLTDVIEVAAPPAAVVEEVESEEEEEEEQEEEEQEEDAEAEQQEKEKAQAKPAAQAGAVANNAVSALGDGGTFRLRAGTGDNLCLDVAWSVTSSGADLHQWNCNDSTAQQFTLRKDGDDGVFNLHAMGNCLDVNGSSQSPGAKVHQWNCNGTDAQRWRVESTGEGVFRLRSVVSGHCLDVAGNSSEVGAKIHQWNCNDAGAQRWTLERR